MTGQLFEGQSLAPGWATGYITVPPYLGSGPMFNERASKTPHEEQRQFQEQAAGLLGELWTRAAKLEEESLVNEAGIVRAQAAILEDSAFHEKVKADIEMSGMTAGEAIETAFEVVATALAASNDPLFSERAADCRDLAQQLQARLTEGGTHSRCFTDEICDPIILIDELLPSMVLQAWEDSVRGFVVSPGTALAHAAIIAQSVGMPVVRLPTIEPLRDRQGERVVLDADAGRLILQPAKEEFGGKAQSAVDKSWRTGKSHVKLHLSIMTPEQLVDQDWHGIEGVGLYRTEMLFLRQSERFPSEDEQFTAYKRLFNFSGDRPVVIRTADLGADKPLAHMHLGSEVNPYLGLRAHRLFLYHPEILITQLRAILKAASGSTRPRILFPMLETVDEWKFVHSLLEQAVESLRKERAVFAAEYETGILIETPAAVWAFPDLIRRADFASVGTNDLVQYIFAAERDAPNVRPYYKPEHPVMLRILQWLVRQSTSARKELSLCGEIASEPAFLPLVVGLGFKHLTVSASQVDEIGALTAELNVDDCVRLAEECLAMEDAAAVRKRLDLATDRTAKMDNQSGHAVDPVCGMLVHKQRSVFSLTRDDVEYYFCCARCLQAFDAN